MHDGSLVCSWFFDSENAADCKIYPSTNFLLGEFRRLKRGTGCREHWMGFEPDRTGLPGPHPDSELPARPISSTAAPLATDRSSAASAISKSRGFKVVFYPFLLGTGRLSLARANHFRRTFSAPRRPPSPPLWARRRSARVHSGLDQSDGRLSGNPYDWTYRRMILHYANLCCVAGGVNLFVIGSELAGSRPCAGRLGPGRHDGRNGKGDLGLSVRRGSQDPGERRPDDIRQPG